MDVHELLEQRRTAFVTKRRDIEVWVDKFFAEVDAINPNLLKETHPPEGRTAQELFPSMYKEPFVQEEFDAEYAKLNAYYEEIQEVANFLNTKAAEVLKG